MSAECTKCGWHVLECICKLLCRRQQNDSKLKKLRKSGLIGCLNDTCITSENYKKREKMIEIEIDDLLELIHWARRYCDQRSTYAPSNFNKLYDKLLLSYPFLKDKDPFDKTLMNKGEFFPYAQDGMYYPENGAFDARK
jgi:hypothetical protein